MKNLVLVLFILLMGAAVGCDEFCNKPKPIPFQNNLSTQTWEGVVLHGCNSAVSWIENTNKLAVKIRGVHFGTMAENQYGEITYFMKRLDAGEKYQIGGNKNTSFYIYSIEGNLIGWLSGGCP